MPIGLFILIALSVMVSRQARQVGRSSVLRVMLLWLSCFVGGYVFAWLAVLFLSLGDMFTEAQARSGLFVPTMVGMVLGGVAIVFAVNRARSEPIQDSAQFASKDNCI